jgi:hypothetical protein
VTLRDRLRRWWNPAQWEDDHPTERKQREQPKKSHWFTSPAEMKLNDDMYNRGPSGRTDYERDLKKQR